MKKSQSMTSLRTCATALLLCCALPAHAQNTVSAGKFRGFVDQYCAGCHNQDDYAGGLDLASTLKEDITLHTENWEKVVRKLRAGMMPPPGEDRPARDSYEQTTRWLEDEIDRHAKSSPGAVTLHRLNRIEYANAIRDLLDLEAERARVEERGLLGVADIEADMVDVDQLQGIGCGRDAGGRAHGGHRPRF